MAITFNDVGDIIVQNLTIRLSDTEGVGRFTIEDAVGFPMHSFDSKGNYRQKGRTQRTQRVWGAIIWT